MIQNEQIADHLLKGNKITSIEALDLFQCFRCASRISELKNKGFIISDKTVETTTGKHVSQYWMEEDNYIHNFKIFMTVFAQNPKFVVGKNNQMEFI